MLQSSDIMRNENITFFSFHRYLFLQRTENLLLGLALFVPHVKMYDTFKPQQI